MNLANPIITSSVIIEREILDKIGWFRNLPFAADYDCWRGVMQFTDCYFVNEKLIYYDNSHGDGRNYLNNSMNKKQIHFYTYGDSKNIKSQKSI